MSIFSSSTRRDDPDIELSLPLYSLNENRSSGFLSSSTPHIPTSRSASPRPPENRIPLPQAPPNQFSPSPFSSIIRRGWRQSWQTILLAVLVLYTLYTLFRPPALPEIAAEYDGGPARRDITRLVIVTGHAIWMGGSTLGVDEKEWTLLPYQHGLGNTFRQHISTGVDISRSDEGSLLVFTGGETRRSAGPLSEAQSYWSLAYMSKRIEPNSSLFNRSTTEEFARDSYENLLFSICRFHEYTSNYPSKITVIGFEFKRERFEKVHRNAIRYPSDKFEYIGIDNKGDRQQEAGFQKGEKEGALPQFRVDPHACASSELVGKKKGRNPFRTRHGYEVTCPELKELLRWCARPEAVIDGKAQLFTGELPWTKK